jgi:uncharacterized protein (TIGR00369 family)
VSTYRRSISAEQRAEVEAWLASAAFNTFYRFRVGALGAGECTIEAPYRDEFERPGGGVSGPVFMAAADVAIYLAIATRRGAHQRWVTVDLNTAFLRAAVREPFTCRARVLRLGRRLAYVVAECTRADGALLTHHTATYTQPPGESRETTRRRRRPAAPIPR